MTPDPAILAAVQAINRPRLIKTIEAVRDAIKAVEAARK